MTFNESTFTFTGDPKNRMLGFIHRPENFATNIGLLIIVGGPQYHIGAHRQYVHMARHCATQGIAVMRFDYQGVGDSEGLYPGFEYITPDIHCAVYEFLKRTPEIQSVAIWGLCEGASAILLGGAEHKAVSHIILANPWVRTESGLAKAFVKHYYLDRLKSQAFWRKIISRKLDIKSTAAGVFSNIKKAFIPPDIQKDDNHPFPERMLSGLREFQGKSLMIMSEQDLVAREFDDLISADKRWQNTITEKISQRDDIPETDHTFSTERWRMKVAESTANWLLSEKP